MSTELIRAVYIKPDGVFLNSASYCNDRPFHTSKNDWLSDIYRNEGQQGLDREIVRMLFSEDYEIKGNHPSVARFRPCLEKGEDIYREATNEVDPKIFQLIIDGDYSITYPPEQHSEAARECSHHVDGTLKAAYERIAQFANPPDKMRDTGAR